MITLDPANVHAMINLAMMLAQQGQPADAEAMYRRAIEHTEEGEKDAEVLCDLGKLVAEHKDDVEEAEALCRQALSIDESHVESLCTLGGLLRSRGGKQAKEAERLLRCVPAQPAQPQAAAGDR